MALGRGYSPLRSFQTCLPSQTPVLDRGHCCWPAPSSLSVPALQPSACQLWEDAQGARPLPARSGRMHTRKQQQSSQRCFLGGVSTNMETKPQAASEVRGACKSRNGSKVVVD